MAPEAFRRRTAAFAARRLWARVGEGMALCALLSVTVGCDKNSQSGSDSVAKLADGSAAIPRKQNWPGGSMAGNPVTTAIHFTDATSRTGIAFQYRDGQEAGVFSMLESLGGGAAATDFDGDGHVDLVFAGGGEFGPAQEIRGLPPAAFRNDGDWRFTRVDAEAGLSLAPYYNFGVAAGDCNDDGFPDLLLTGYGGLTLYRNQGDGTFVESAREAGLTDSLWSSSAAWGDLNGDGYPDLYVVHYVNWSLSNHPVCTAKDGHRDLCGPRDFEPLPHTLYANNGDGTFRDASEEAGLRPDGKGLAVLLADLDLDGRLDIYVGNDSTPKFLYRNLGNLQFEEIGLQSGASLSDRGDPDGSMGLDVLDFNLDGLPDLWVANFEDETFALYRNQGNCLFRHVSRVTGIVAIGGLYVGWGTVASDFDRDGDEDMFVSDGHVIRYPTRATVKQLPLVFENLGNERFINVASRAGEALSIPHLGRGLAAADFDDDGDLDLALTPINEPSQILINDSRSGHHWLAIKLVGTQGSRDAIGAVVRLETAAGSQIRLVKAGGSYASTSDSRVFFGLGAANLVSRLEICWPSGTTQVFNDVAVDRFMRIIEPRPRERPTP